MQSSLWLKIVGAVLFAGTASFGVYEMAKTYSTEALEKAVTERIAQGDYLAALAAAGTLKENGAAVSPALEAKVAAAARLLVAEEAFAKAKQAATEARFADAGALLRGSDALSPEFKYAVEARALYAEVEARAAAAAHEAAVALSQLETQAAAEKGKRVHAEGEREALSQTLRNKEAALTEAARTLETTRADAAAKEASLRAQIEAESKQKFFTELKTYRDMANKGREQLDNAVAEIQAKRDVTALVYISQGKILFEEAKNKTNDLRGNRTPSAYEPRVDNLLKALGEFVEASRQLRNAVAYIEEQGSTEFTGGFGKGKTALANGISYLSSVSDFIAGN